MSARLPRTHRLGLPAVAVLALALVGCSETASPTPSAPPPSSAPAAPASPLAPLTGGTGSDGLTVRHLAADGTVKTVRVEDFRR